jgi:hypothetical protein
MSIACPFFVGSPPRRRGNRTRRREGALQGEPNKRERIKSTARASGSLFQSNVGA